MASICLATASEAPSLVELYCKALKVAAMDKGPCAEERRKELIEWLARHCTEGKIFVLRDENGPVALAHYEAVKSEVVTVVVRDNMERKGVATKLVGALQARASFLKAFQSRAGERPF
jgi:predicted GNAT family acetyltransferase